MSASDRSPAPRADARAVVAVGRRQDDDLARAARARRQPQPCRSRSRRGRRGRARSTAYDYHFIDPGRLRPDGRPTASCSSMRKVFGNYYGTPRAAGGAGAGRRAATCCSTSTGRARSSWRRTRATIWSASSSCRPRPQNWSAGCRRRAQDSAEVVAQRMAKAADEMSHWARIRLRHRQPRPRGQRRASVQAILAAERLRRERQIGLDDFVAPLRERP